MPDAIRIRIGIEGRAPAKLHALARQLRPALLGTWRDIVADVFARSQRKLSGDVLRVRTGHLRGSGMMEVHATATGVEGTVGYRAVYARPLEEGSRPYTIRPRRAKALRFLGRDGRLVFARSVQHPGLRPRPFLRPSAEEVLPTVHTRVGEIVARTFAAG